MSKEYFVRISGQAFGPITAQQVVQLAAQGKLKASDFVREGQGQWVLACNVNGLVLADQLGSPGNQITSNVSSATSQMIGPHDALQRQSRKPHLTAPVAIVLGFAIVIIVGAVAWSYRVYSLRNGPAVVAHANNDAKTGEGESLSSRKPIDEPTAHETSPQSGNEQAKANSSERDPQRSESKPDDESAWSFLRSDKLASLVLRGVSVADLKKLVPDAEETTTPSQRSNGQHVYSTTFEIYRFKEGRLIEASTQVSTLPTGYEREVSDFKQSLRTGGPPGATFQEYTGKHAALQVYTRWQVPSLGLEVEISQLRVSAQYPATFKSYRKSTHSDKLPEQTVPAKNDTESVTFPLTWTKLLQMTGNESSSTQFFRSAAGKLSRVESRYGFSVIVAVQENQNGFDVAIANEMAVADFTTRQWFTPSESESLQDLYIKYVTSGSKLASEWIRVGRFRVRMGYDTKYSNMPRFTLLPINP